MIAELGDEWMKCQKHFSCINEQDRMLMKYEALSSYPLEELDEEQKQFLIWFENATS